MPGKEDKVEITEQENEATQAEESPENEISLSEEELKALCREHVCPECDVMSEAKDERLRALAETENIKKRLIRETEELKKYAADSILSDLLPVLDNLDLALNHAQNLDACKDFVTGVDMTRKMFLDTLAKHGLEAVGKAGDEFDPNFHEAMGMAQASDLPDGSIAQVMQRGYVLKGRVIRPAKVMVNKLG
ncbi:nucleotide exchange factor GrpE [Maridesulfovibrio zosterae]|uniref:nucleotide exchange factor GrpE n=1 Tax=Maridesulfovibrio zosterae TaxID=82171 RepID=UPI00041F7BD5|nr:nucleotide exchange factor GrpE [Maridesulfovibrio zosterae]